MTTTITTYFPVQVGTVIASEGQWFLVVATEGITHTVVPLTWRSHLAFWTRSKLYRIRNFWLLRVGRLWWLVMDWWEDRNSH